jgi:hypothetical protein
MDKKKKNPSQSEQILSYMKKYRKKGITPIEALSKFGCFRLAARIHDLREDGHAIKSERHRLPVKGEYVARYFLEYAKKK